MTIYNVFEFLYSLLFLGLICQAIDMSNHKIPLKSIVLIILNQLLKSILISVVVYVMFLVLLIALSDWGTIHTDSDWEFFVSKINFEFLKFKASSDLREAYFIGYLVPLGLITVIEMTFLGKKYESGKI